MTPTDMQAAFESWMRSRSIITHQLDKTAEGEYINLATASNWVTWRAALASRPDAQADEPIAYEFQHDETGRTTFVDPWQVEQGFAANNPRWQLIGPVFRHARAAAPSPDREKAASPSRECGERQGAATARVCDTCSDGDCLADNAGLPCPFSASLRSIDEHDPQSFINGVKWAREHAASAPTLGDVDIVAVPRDLLKRIESALCVDNPFAESEIGLARALLSNGGE